MILAFSILLFAILGQAGGPPSPPVPPDVVSFSSGDLALSGVLYVPQGSGPFPALLFNHGSAPGMLNNQAFDLLGPLFADRGWVFFAPYRRGQGLSEEAGLFIGDQIAEAQRGGARRALPAIIIVFGALTSLMLLITRKRHIWFRAVPILLLVVAGAVTFRLTGLRAGAATMVQLLETDHVDDQLAALSWLEEQDFVDSNRIATGGNSFGGIVTVLAAERVAYCAALDASGGSQSWSAATQLRQRMTQAVRGSQAPVFFFQAENDYNLSPSQTLSTEMESVGKTFEVKIYPPFGTSSAQGHSFAWRGSSVWAADVFEFLEEHCG